MLPACGNDCRRACSQRIPENEREIIWSQFWSMDYQRRRDFLSYCVSENETQHPKKQKNSTVSRRSKTLHYKIKDLQVCQKFFLHTLGYKGDKVVRCMLGGNKKLGLVAGVGAAPDMRGKHTPANKFPEGYKDRLTDYILSYLSNSPTKSPKGKSRPAKRYLPLGISGKQIFKNWSIKQNEENGVPCSWSYFHQLFKSLNIWAKPPAVIEKIIDKNTGKLVKNVSKKHFQEPSSSVSVQTYQNETWTIPKNLMMVDPVISDRVPAFPTIPQENQRFDKTFNSHLATVESSHKTFDVDVINRPSEHHSSAIKNAIKMPPGNYPVAHPPTVPSHYNVTSIEGIAHNLKQRFLSPASVKPNDAETYIIPDHIHKIAPAMQ